MVVASTSGRPPPGPRLRRGGGRPWRATRTRSPTRRRPPPMAASSTSPSISSAPWSRAWTAALAGRAAARDPGRWRDVLLARPARLRRCRQAGHAGLHLGRHARRARRRHPAPRPGRGSIHARTGCHLHACYWPAKLRWLAHEGAGVLRRVTRWGSIGEYLEQTFLGEAATSISMASAPGCSTRRAPGTPRCWPPRASRRAGSFPSAIAAAAGQACGALVAPVARPGRRPWFPALGDGATSTIGSDCLDPSRIALNVGTSAALRFVAADRSPPRAGCGATAWTGGGLCGRGDLGGRQRPRLAPERPAVARRRRGRGGAGPDGARHPWTHGASLSRRRALAGMARRAPGGDIRPLPRHEGRRDRAGRAGGRRSAPGPRVRAARPAGGAATPSSPPEGRPPLAGMGADGRRRAGRPLGVSSEEEATSRGCALLALESLGRPRSRRGPGGWAVVDPTSPPCPIPRGSKRQRELDEGYDLRVTA